MSQQTRLEALAQAIGTDIKGLQQPLMLDLVSRERGTYYVAHRGGSNRFPEETNLGLNQSFEDGFWLEVDVQPNSQGDIVCMHDDTVNRTTTGTGTVISKTTEQFKALSTRPPIPGARRAPALMWNEVVNKYGGRAVLLPELKGSNWTLSQRNAFFDDIIARGLQKSVIVQSFTYSWVLEAIAKGIRGMALGTSQTASQMAADGVWGVGISAASSTTYAGQCKTAGLKLFVYTVNTRYTKDQWSTGTVADGFFSDDPWWISKRWPLHVASADRDVEGDNWHEKIPWPGMIGSPKLGDPAVGPGDPNRSVRGEFVGQRGFTPYPYLDSSTTTVGVPMTFCTPKGPNVRIRTRVFYSKDAASQTRWGAIYWGALDPEIGFNDSNAEPNGGYHFLYRRNGTLELFNCPANASSTSIATLTTGPVLAAGVGELDGYMELEINATQVIGRLIVGGTVYTVSANNTSYRPTQGYAQLNINDQYVEFSEFSIRKI